jgi:hypothetical protein
VEVIQVADYNGRFEGRSETLLFIPSRHAGGAMTRKYSSRYWDSLFSSREYGRLVDLSSAVCSCSVFRPDDPEYGLPRAAFTFVEGLLWFAQANRSGVWTYFESTPQPRQSAMLDALETGDAPPGFAAHYALGMRDWKAEDKSAQVDSWIRAHDAENNEWLWHVAEEHRSLFEGICDRA